MSWVKRLAARFRARAASARSRKRGTAPRGRRVAVEALEDRRLLSVDSGLMPVDTGGIVWSSSPVVFGDAVYFAASDSEHGCELWKMDASENVSLVADINPGIASSAPEEPTVLGDKLYFSADDGVHGRELWCMDSAGTVSLVVDICAGSDSSNAHELTVFENEIYMTARHGASDMGILKVDASGNLSTVFEFTRYNSVVVPAALTVIGDHLYFHEPSRYTLSVGDPAIWKLDDAGNIYNLGQVPYTIQRDSSSLQFVELDERVFILDYGWSLHPGIWELDESGGTTFIADLVPERPHWGESVLFESVVFGGTVYVPILYDSTTESGHLVWAFDGSGNVHEAFTFDPLYLDGWRCDLIVWNERLYFGTDDRELYSLGIGETEVGVVAVVSEARWSPLGNFVGFGDYLYFSTGSSATPIWKVAAPQYDFGDAPDTFGTTHDANGAQHLLMGPTLGALRDADADGLPSSTADADDLADSDDEDGITFATGTFVTSATVNVQNAPSGAKLDAWIDFNRDGAFGPGEQIAASLDVTEGDNSLRFVIPEGTIPGQTYARFRLSTTGGLAPTGSAADGEIEDYAVTIIPADTPYYFHTETVDVGHGLFPGEAASLSVDGDYAIRGAQIYHRDGNEWREMELLSPDSSLDTTGFGRSSRISSTRVVVAGDKSVFVYELADGEWQARGEWTLPVDAGSTILEVELDGEMIAVATEDTVFVRQLQNGAWLPHGEWALPDDQGTISDVALEGQSIAVLSHWPTSLFNWQETPYYASVSVIEQVDGNWQSVLTPEVFEFVGAIQLKNGTLGVSKCGFHYYTEWDDPGHFMPGFVAVYRRTDDGWKGGYFPAEVTTIDHGLLFPAEVWDDGLGLGLAVDGDLAFGVADEYILELRWNESLSQWQEVDETSADWAQPIALDGETLAHKNDQGVIVRGPGGMQQILLDSSPRSLMIDGETLYLSQQNHVHWYDLNFESETEEFLVPVKQGGEISVSTSGQIVPTIEIYDPAGQLVASGENGSLTYVTSSVGVYTVTTTAHTDQWVSYGVSILSEVPPPSAPLVADYLELTYALPPDRATLFSLEAARDGYLTILGIEQNATDQFGFVLLDQDKNVLTTSSPVTTNASGAWPHDRRLDYLATAGESFYLMVLGDGSQVDLRVCNLVTQTGSTVDVFDTAGADAYLFTVSDTFNVTANGVDYQFDDADTFSFHSTAGADSVELVDSDGDDTLTVSPTQMAISGMTNAGQTFTATADGFAFAHGYARAGGNDLARFTGSERSDRLKVDEDLVKLMGGGYYTRAKLFETVEADLGGGFDSAVVAASDGTDVLQAMKERTRVAYGVNLAAGAVPAFATMAYDVTVTGCEQVVARAKGADDWAELHDSAGSDVLIAKTHKVEIMNAPRLTEGVERGDEYCIIARGYRNLTAVADQGGDGDVAKLYDSGELGVDIWAAGYVDGKTWSSMTSPTRLLYEVLAFEQVGGYGANDWLGENHGTNRKQHAADVDFVFQYGWWEADQVPVQPSPRQGRGRR